MLDDIALQEQVAWNKKIENTIIRSVEISPESIDSSAKFNKAYEFREAARKGQLIV